MKRRVRGEWSAAIHTNVPLCPPANYYCAAYSGNSALRPQIGLGEDIGYDRTFGTVGRLSLDLYRSSVADHIFNGVTPAAPAPGNVAPKSKASS